MTNQNQSKFNRGISTLIGILIIVAFAVLAGGILVWQYFGIPKEKVKPPKEVSFIETGTIEGSLGYPSEGIPEMKICAENIATKKQYCTEEHIQDNEYTYGVGYKIEVPIGNYYVFATLPSAELLAELPGGEDYRAYYSEFVTCGLSINCLSHKPIAVKVNVSQIVKNIDPQDWYGTSEQLENETADADWKIYRNEEYGFEVRYPDDWIKSSEICDYDPFCLEIIPYSELPEAKDVEVCFELPPEYCTKEGFNEQKNALIEGTLPSWYVQDYSNCLKIIKVDGKNAVRTMFYNIFLARHAIETEIFTDDVGILLKVALPIQVFYKKNEAGFLATDNEKNREREKDLCKGIFSNEEVERAISQYDQMLSTFRFLE